MNSSPDNTSGSISGAAESRPFSAGGALREAREKLGLSVADVSNRLKFAPRQIEALEADDFARLPEIAFVRGFMRSYAKLLQIESYGDNRKCQGRRHIEVLCKKGEPDAKALASNREVQWNS